MLIETKLITTPLKSRLLLRKALIERLCAAGGYPLVLISGPAGSGKTSLACQWIQQANLRTAWYSLDKEDNEPDLFYRYFLTTLARTDEHLAMALGPVLENQRKLTGAMVVPHLIACLSTLFRDIHMVLEDFHRITNEKIHATLARLIQYIPARLHLVILSRYCLPGPMDAIILKKERLVISASNLQFTDKETATLYKEVIPLGFSPDQIRDLNRHMEGWAAGLQLIGLSAGSRGPIPDLSNILSQTHEQVANYLIHDVLRMQPVEIRNFIFATALLDRFNPELSAEVTGIPDAAKILERLERMNLFLIPLDTRRQWYRYHHIFSQVVRRQAAARDPDAICAILCKAALWSAQNNHLEDALRSAFQSNDIEFTADLMEDYIIKYIETFDLAAGLRWILKLPERVLNQRPLLRLQQCIILSLLTEFSDVKEILSALEINGAPDFGRYSGHKLSLCRDYAAYLKCTLNLFHAREYSVIKHYQVLRNKICPQNPLLVGFIETHIVLILISKGDLSAAESFLARLAKLPLSSSNHRMQKKIYHAQAKALIARYRGRLRKAEGIIFQVLQSSNRQGHQYRPLAYLLSRHLGNIFYLQNRLEKARACAASAVKYCEYFGLIDEILAGNELQLQLHLAAGDNEQAVQCIQQMRAYSEKLGIPLVAVSAEACAAQMAIDRGNLAAAELWSVRRNLRSDEPFSMLFGMECLIQARLFCARKRYGEAAQLLEILKNRCILRHLAELVLQIDILQSATRYAMDQQAKGESLLKEALAFSETEGYIRPFVNDAKLIAPILQRIADKLPRARMTHHLETIFSACGISLHTTAASRNSGLGGHEALTQREIEILGWMAQGFQNKEIAQKACIAITTVKSHVSNILVKLDVKTRTQAILKSREIELLKMK